MDKDIDTDLADVAAVQEIRDALNRLEKRGLRRDQVIALIADELDTGWCGRKQTWHTRKQRVNDVLSAMASASVRK